VWEGDRAFLTLLAQDSPFFSMKLRYQGDELVEKQVKIYGNSRKGNKNNRRKR
jgi:hypothetical protein